MRRLICVGVLVTLTQVTVTPRASAHDGEASIEVVPSMVTSGQSVIVYGENLPPGAEVELVLLTGVDPIPLATAQAGADGHLDTEMIVPADLGRRIYEIQALADGAEVDSAFITIEPRPEDRRGPPAVVFVGAMFLVAVLIISLARHLAAGRAFDRRRAR